MANLKQLSDNIVMKKRLKCAYSFEPNFANFWPKKIIEQTKESAKNLSVPHLGIILAIIINLEYFMSFSEVQLEHSDWKEPILAWIMMFMGSGTRKSAIYSFIEDVLYNKTMNIIRQNKEQKQGDSEFLLHETTFEKLGSLLEENNGRKLWVFDEARHFWSQIGKEIIILNIKIIQFFLPPN